MAIFKTFAKNVISLLIGVFSCGFLHSANLGQFSFQSILIRLSGDLYFLFFQPSEVRPKNRPFLKIFPWSPLCYFAKNGHFRHFCEKCYFSSNRCFFMRFFAQRKSRIVQLSILTNQAIRRVVFPIFLAFQSSTKKWAIFENFPLVPPLLFCEKCYFSSNRCFFMRFFAQRKSRIAQRSIHTNQAIRRLVFPIFLAFRSSTKKSAIFENFPLVPPLLFCEKCYFSSNRCFFMRFFAQRKSRIVQLSIHTNQAIRRLVFPIFLAFRSSTKKNGPFLKIFSWSPLCYFGKMLFFF